MRDSFKAPGEDDLAHMHGLGTLFIATACLFSLLAGLVPTAHAGFGFKLDGSLDKEAISRAYFESEFDRARFPLSMT